MQADYITLQKALMNMKLIIPWDHLVSQINDLIKEAEDFDNRIQPIKLEGDLDLVNEDIKQWAVKGKDILEKSFEPPNLDVGRDFFYSAEHRYNIPGGKKYIEQLRKEALGDLREKKQYLSGFKRYYSIADAIVRPESIDLDGRAKLDTIGKLDFILDKLYDLSDGRQYSIAFILESNGITFRPGEEREHVKMLEERGLVRSMHIRTAAAEITLEGKIYVEDKRKIYIEDYSTINDNSTQINATIDEILERLNKLGYGQEIIFNEIDELKTLYTTMSKKTFGQVVKGKLLDLALAKLIENDTLGYIFEKLTHHPLRLP